MNKENWLRRGAMLTTALGLVAMPALAQGPGWTVISTVTALVNTAAGGVNVRLSPELSGCVSQSGYGSNYASVYPNHPAISRIKADLLTALATGARVQLYLGDNQCQVSETILYPQ